MVTANTDNGGQGGDRVAIVGAGPAGLATARALQSTGIGCQVFERHSECGGIWAEGNAGSPMYDSAHFISSKTMSGFTGYPMPDDYPDYPSWRQIARYIQGFAAHYELEKLVQFNTPVERAEMVDGRWLLHTPDGTAGDFRWLVCANGTNWFPRVPEIEGEAAFGGEVIHSSAFHSAEQFRGKRVLIVGAGNSGVDIACDAAVAAERALISLRRGYHFIPKHVFGTPVDVFGAGSSWMPLWIQRLTTGMLLRLITGDLTKLGLPKPDHELLESHPIINSQILHYLQHGRLAVKPDVARFVEEGVEFVDGSREALDLVVLATGYEHQIPFLPEGVFEFHGGHPKAFMGVYNPGRPEVFLSGFIETNAGAYPLFEKMAQMIAMAVKAQAEGGASWEKLRGILEGPAPLLKRGIRYVDSARHAEYINAESFVKEVERLRKRMGWPRLEEEFGG